MIALAGPTWVYSLDDEDVQTLYVGVTADLTHRLRTHRREKPWWPSVAIIHAELYPTRVEALAWESMTIRRGTPYNIQIPREHRLPGVQHPFENSLRSEQLYPSEV